MRQKRPTIVWAYAVSADTGPNHLKVHVMKEVLLCTIAGFALLSCNLKKSHSNPLDDHGVYPPKPSEGGVAKPQFPLLPSPFETENKWHCGVEYKCGGVVHGFFTSLGETFSTQQECESDLRRQMGEKSPCGSSKPTEFDPGKIMFSNWATKKDDPSKVLGKNGVLIEMVHPSDRSLRVVGVGYCVYNTAVDNSRLILGYLDEHKYISYCMVNRFYLSHNEYVRLKWFFGVDADPGIHPESRDVTGTACDGFDFHDPSKWAKCAARSDFEPSPRRVEASDVFAVGCLDIVLSKRGKVIRSNK
jgi:hypothetical protein